MKYTVRRHIDLPREQVVKLIDNPDNLEKWQPELVSFERISGDTNKPGAKSKLVYQMGKRKVEMTETITKRNLPEEFHARYEARGVLNIQENYFKEAGNNGTLWTSINEFKFKGAMKFFALLMPRAFRRQTLKYMERFKEFAESGPS